MATARKALSSIMDTVEVSASSFTAAIAMGANTINMAAKKQAARHEIEFDDYLDQLEENSAKATALRHKEIKDLCKDAEFKSDFEKAQSRNAALLARFRTPTATP